MMKDICLNGKLLCRAEVVKGLNSYIGLMFRRKLPEGEGLILKCPKGGCSIHTWFMRFAIDVFFLDENFRVLDKTSMRPWNVYRPKGKASFVLETNAGEIEPEIGDGIEINQNPSNVS